MKNPQIQQTFRIQEELHIDLHGAIDNSKEENQIVSKSLLYCYPPAHVCVSTFYKIINSNAPKSCYFFFLSFL